MCIFLALFTMANIGRLAFGAPLQLVGNDTTTLDGDINNCPRIVSRTEWGARKVNRYVPMSVSPTPYVVAHHGGIPHYCYDEDTCCRIVRGYQNLHMDTQGWIDIGYQFVVGCDGNVYEGRGWDHEGAHAPGYNTQSIGISIIGDYTDHMPNDAALEAFEKLIECGVSLGKIRPDYKLIGHRQARNTECPGGRFYEYIKNSTHWDPHPKPLRAASSQINTRVKAKLPKPTVDITGTSLWTDLIALGVPERDSNSDSPSLEHEAKSQNGVANTENTNDNLAS